MIENQLNARFAVVEALVAEARTLFLDTAPALQPEGWAKTLDAIQKPQYAITVVGPMKSGKSTMLNALLFAGRPVLPSEVTECTAALATIQGGGSDQAKMVYLSREEVRQSVQDINEWLTKNKTHHTAQEVTAEVEIIKKAMSRYDVETAQENFSLSELGQCLAKDLSGPSGSNSDPVYRSRLVKEAVIEVTHDLLAQDNIRFIDTPGIHSPVRSRVEISKKKIAASDCVLLLVPHKGVDQSTIDFLNSVLGTCPAGKIFALLGQCDRLAMEGGELYNPHSETFNHQGLAKVIKKQVQDLEKNLEKLLAAVANDLFRNIKVIPVAPKLVMNGGPEAEGSNLQRLSTQLFDFLAAGKGTQELTAAWLRLQAVLQKAKGLAQGNKEALGREAKQLDQSVAEVRDKLDKLEGASREIQVKQELFKAAYQGTRGKWEQSFKTHPGTVVDEARAKVGSLFAGTRSKIKNMGWWDRHSNYNEQALEAIKEMTAAIEIEVFWNIQEKLKIRLHGYRQACTDEAATMFHRYVDTFQTEYSGILGPVAYVMDGVKEELDAAQFKNWQGMSKTLGQESLLARLFSFFSPPDCGPVLDNHEREINQAIKETVENHCQLFKDQTLHGIDGLRDTMLKELDWLLQAEQGRTKETLIRLGQATLERDRRKAKINTEQTTIDGFTKRILALKDRLDKQKESCPVITQQPYQERDQDIATMARCCERGWQTWKDRD